jgi:hypothetical protein
MDPLPPAGASAGTGDPDSVAVMPWVVPRLAELLGRDLAAEPATTGPGRPSSGRSPRRASALWPVLVLL